MWGIESAFCLHYGSPKPERSNREDIINIGHNNSKRDLTGMLSCQQLSIG